MPSPALAKWRSAEQLECPGLEAADRQTDALPQRVRPLPPAVQAEVEAGDDAAVKLTWTAATDNVAVTGYIISRQQTAPTAVAVA